MSSALFDTVTRIARQEASARATAGVGVVEDVFDSGGAAPDHAVTVRMRASDDVLPRVPVVVGALGFTATPAVGDLVAVLFLDGDPNAPLVVGRLYHGDLEPPQHTSDEIVLQLPPGESEPSIDFKVAALEPVVRLALPNDVVVEVREERIELTAGAMQVTIAAGGGGQVKLTAGSTEVDLKEDGDISLKTSGKLVLEGSEVQISGSSSVKIEGATVELN